MSTHAEALLRFAVERSTNLKVLALACLSLGRYLQNLVVTARDFNHPVRGQSLREWFGPETVRQIREFKPEDLKREAEVLFERTIHEFADLRPMGKDFPPLGEQARGDLFKLRHLEPGSTCPRSRGRTSTARR